MLSFLYKTSDPHFDSTVKRPLSLGLVRSHLGYAREALTPLHISALRTIDGVKLQTTK